MNSLVSIVIATYRRDDKLVRAIKSAVDQSYCHIEIIVVDDNAETEWNKKVSKIVSGFPQVRYICNDSNKGSAETRNIGISASQGEYVSFLDDDDVYLPERIKSQVENMEKNNADFSLTDLYLFDDDGVLREKRRHYELLKSNTNLMRYHLMHHMTGTDTMMFKTSYLKKIGGFDAIDVGDEFYLMSKAIEGNGVFSYMPQCDVMAYVHTSNGGISTGENKIKGEMSLFQYKKTYFKALDFRAKQYIKMRHFAVLAYAGLISDNKWAFIKNGIIAFLCSPFDSVGLILQRREKD